MWIFLGEKHYSVCNSACVGWVGDGWGDLSEGDDLTKFV